MELTGRKERKTVDSFGDTIYKDNSYNGIQIFLTNFHFNVSDMYTPW